MVLVQALAQDQQVMWHDIGTDVPHHPSAPTSTLQVLYPNRAAQAPPPSTLLHAGRPVYRPAACCCLLRVAVLLVAALPAVLTTVLIAPPHRLTATRHHLTPARRLDYRLGCPSAPPDPYPRS